MDRERYILPRTGERPHTAAATDSDLGTIDAQFDRRPYVVRIEVHGSVVTSLILRNVTGAADVLTLYPADGKICRRFIGPNTGGVANWPGYGQQFGYSTTVSGAGNYSVSWEVAEVS